MDNLVIYRDLSEDSDVIELLKCLEENNFNHYFLSLCMKITERYEIEGNVVESLLTYLLANHTNVFTLALERKESIEDSLKKYVLEDLNTIYDLYHTDVSNIPLIANFKRSKPIINKEITELLIHLKDKLHKTRNVEEFYNVLYDHYHQYGAGKYGLNKAFRYSEGKIIPIEHIDNNTLDELVGLKKQKQTLIDNTEAFLQGRKANNVLLYGDNGTGKSSSVKALLNQYYKDGLRIVEVYKHQFLHLPEIIEELQNHHYQFILFMDDLSFEEYETEYKYLKAVIEGGLEKKPDNILIYATSNRRHIVKETWNERNDNEVNVNDARQEKLSLFSRFGIQILYSHPNKNMYLEIVDVLAKRYNIDINEDMHRQAMEWELRHGGYSGRVATQFIHHLLSLKGRD